MLKVLLVDDEPFILQGLKMLLDWEAAGYEVHTATNGKEALDFYKLNPVDLIIADIKMPVMTGLELLKELRETINSDVYFVILSGYAEFNYAQEALRYNCTDYILKPVEKEQLVEILQKVSTLNTEKESINQDRAKKERAYLDRNLMALLSGKYDKGNIEYLSDKINIDEEMCYLEVQLDDETLSEDYSDDEKKEQLKKLYAAATEFLKNDSDLCVMDVSDSEKIYDLGFIYTESMGQRLQLSMKEFIEGFLDYIIVNTNLSATVLVGKTVSGIKNISKSYGTANMLRSLQGFREKKKMYYYEDEYKVTDSGIIICKKQLDDLIDAIETTSITPPAGYEYSGKKYTTTVISYEPLGKWVTSKEALGEYTYYVKTVKQYKYAYNKQIRYLIDEKTTTSIIPPDGYEYSGRKYTTTKVTYIPLGKWVTSVDKLGEYTYNIKTQKQYKYAHRTTEKYIKDRIWTTENVAREGYELTGNTKTTSKTTYIDLGMWVNSKKELGEYTYNIQTRTQYKYKTRTIDTKTEYKWARSNPGNGFEPTGNYRKIWIQDNTPVNKQK